MKTFMRVLLDTCVILDAMQERGTFAKFAQMLLLASAQGKFDGCVSSKQICDIYYILHKVHHNDAKCRTLLSNLFDVIEVVDCSPSCVLDARVSLVSDYEDAVLIECAKLAKCKFIATSNVSDFRKSSLPAVNPKQACEMLGILYANENP